jgi:hypothetical protein
VGGTRYIEVPGRLSITQGRNLSNVFKTISTSITGSAISTTEGINTGSYYIVVRILKSRCGITSEDTNDTIITKFKTWLQAVKFTVVAELEAPLKVKVVSPMESLPSLDDGYNTIICFNSIQNDIENTLAVVDVTELQTGEEGSYCVFKDLNDNTLYPMTYADTVMMADGGTAEDRLVALEAKLNALISS